MSSTAETPFVAHYRNWRSEVAERRLVPLRVRFGATEWHPEPQWLLTAFDLDKGAERDFALADFHPADRDVLAEVERLRLLDTEYGHVEEAIIMADRDFDGDSDHASPRERLIASVQRLKDRAAAAETRIVELEAVEKTLRWSVADSEARLVEAETKAASKREALREATRDVLSSASNTYRKGNGTIGTLQGDDGEMMWIVPFDEFEALRVALAQELAR